MRFYSTKKSIKLLTVLSLGSMCVFAPAITVAGSLYVVAHPGVALTEAELKDVYTGEKQFSGSIKLVPVDNAAVQSEFLSKVMKMDAAVYGALWIKKSFRAGLTTPKVKSGDAEIYSFIHKTPGAIGYVNVPVAGEQVLHKY